jgi:hypothetical protein
VYWYGKGEGDDDDVDDGDGCESVSHNASILSWYRASSSHESTEWWPWFIIFENRWVVSSFFEAGDGKKVKEENVWFSQRKSNFVWKELGKVVHSNESYLNLKMSLTWWTEARNPKIRVTHSHQHPQQSLSHVLDNHSLTNITVGHHLLTTSLSSAMISTSMEPLHTSHRGLLEQKPSLHYETS